MVELFFPPAISVTLVRLKSMLIFLLLFLLLCYLGLNDERALENMGMKSKYKKFNKQCEITKPIKKFQQCQNLRRGNLK